MLYRALRPLLFRLDAERAHNVIFSGLAACEWLLARAAQAPRAWGHAALQQSLWNLTFPNPVGLAAGFDKNGRCPHVWPLMGFGFAELGTVTAAAQPGNPLPRLFRLATDRALINRLGFNNIGAARVAQHLAGLRRAAPFAVPIGINIGKSRITPLEMAPDDYLESLRLLWELADYLVINVSSPNTPGLRDLQDEAHLSALLTVLVRANAELGGARCSAPKPLLIKVSPDLSEDALAAIVRVARQVGAAGLVATNTTTRRDGLSMPADAAGGLSGAPLRERATAVIRVLHRLAGPELPIIGVGGIFTAADAYQKIRAGASLVQMYTGMIYEGPRLAQRIAHGLVELLSRDGLSHLREAIGRDAR